MTTVHDHSSLGIEPPRQRSWLVQSAGHGCTVIKGSLCTSRHFINPRVDVKCGRVFDLCCMFITACDHCLTSYFYNIYHYTFPSVSQSVVNHAQTVLNNAVRLSVGSSSRSSVVSTQRSFGVDLRRSDVRHHASRHLIHHPPICPPRVLDVH